MKVTVPARNSQHELWRLAYSLAKQTIAVQYYGMNIKYWIFDANGAHPHQLYRWMWMNVMLNVENNA